MSPQQTIKLKKKATNNSNGNNNSNNKNISNNNSPYLGKNKTDQWVDQIIKYINLQQGNESFGSNQQVVGAPALGSLRSLLGRPWVTLGANFLVSFRRELEPMI